MSENYFYNHIKLTYDRALDGKYGWVAEAEFFDDGWDDSLSVNRLAVEGMLRTRYCVSDDEAGSGVRAATEKLISDLAAIGVAPSADDDIVLQVMNLENESLRPEFCYVFYTDIPQQDLDEVIMLAGEYGFEYSGVEVQ